MALFKEIGKGLSFIGGIEDFLPNKILSAFNLPQFSSPMHMFGDFLKDPKKFQFGREQGNNMKLGALAATAFLGIPALAHLFSGAASGAASTADVGSQAALPSGQASIFPGELRAPTGDLITDSFGMGQAPQLPSQGLIGGGGGATGTGALDKAGVSPGAGQKGMNPIMKSFIDEFIKSRMQRPQYQPPNLQPMGRTGQPGRQYLPTLGGMWGAG